MSYVVARRRNTIQGRVIEYLNETGQWERGEPKATNKTMQQTLAWIRSFDIPDKTGVFVVGPRGGQYNLRGNYKLLKCQL